MKNQLVKFAIFLLGITLLQSCSNSDMNNELLETKELRSEVYILPDGEKLILEFNTRNKEYVKSDDLLEFENVIKNSVNPVIVNDGSGILRISTLENEEKRENIAGELIEKAASNKQSRVILHDNSYNSGPNITLHLNSFFQNEHRWVSLKNRCVHGVLPIDESCEVDLFKKVSFIELYDNSHLLMGYSNPNPRVNNLRLYKFENPPSSSSDIKKFDLSQIGLNDTFTTIIKVRFFN
ncbi:hypothetical protein [Aquimarina aggregata]|uniref:hypothetical protein n=1 Tax=Aquimarina aggregata TaxID=1642818 RepID=UPI002492BDB6|nr:hypothetical protein [Aquimarina aggregata]